MSKAWPIRVRAKSEPEFGLSGMGRAVCVGRLCTGTLCLLAVMAPTADSAAQDEPGTEPPDSELIHIEGQLTSEGVECQAMRADDGTLYTLIGDLGDFRDGDQVLLEASPAEVSICLQGTTLLVHSISAGAPAARQQ